MKSDYEISAFFTDSQVHAYFVQSKVLFMFIMDVVSIFICFYIMSKLMVKKVPGIRFGNVISSQSILYNPSVVHVYSGSGLYFHLFLYSV